MMELSKYNKYIHKAGNKRWIVAEYDKATRTYTPPDGLRELAKLGAPPEPVTSPEELIRISYSNRGAALRCAARAYGPTAQN